HSDQKLRTSPTALGLPGRCTTYVSSKAAAPLLARSAGTASVPLQLRSADSAGPRNEYNSCAASLWCPESHPYAVNAIRPDSSPERRPHRGTMDDDRRTM